MFDILEPESIRKKSGSVEVGDDQALSMKYAIDHGHGKGWRPADSAELDRNLDPATGFNGPTAPAQHGPPGRGVARR